MLVGGPAGRSRNLLETGIWADQERGEIITKGTGRQTQKRQELGKRRGNVCEEERQRKKKKKRLKRTRKVRASFRLAILLELLLQ